MLLCWEIYYRYAIFYSLAALIGISEQQTMVHLVPDTCKDMKILFWGESSEKPCPFRVTIEKLEIKSGESISATISSVNGTTYKLFLLQARNDEDESFGNFKQTNNTSIYSCHPGRFDMAANADFRMKLKNVVYWISPKEVAENTTVRFVLTVMKDENDYWTSIRSQQFIVIGNDALKNKSLLKYFNFNNLSSFLRWRW